jgi:glutathione synthase/RimK-type ligase-like ATP-grasp enzyme
MNHTRGLLALPTIKNIEEIIKGLPVPIGLTKGSYRNLEFRFQDGVATLLHKDINIKDFSHIWLSSSWKTRDLAYAAKLYLNSFNTPHTYVEKVTSKVTDQMKFILNDISSPNTFFVNNHNISNHLDTIEEVCGFPLIIKAVLGCHGKNSILVNSREELEREAKLLPKNKKYLYQSYIPNDYDWGILVSNGSVVSAEKSYPGLGEFRNNCNGSTEEFVHLKDVPNEVKEIALKASKALGLSWSRSDIIIDKNTGIPYLMEVNRFPGVTSGTREVYGAQSFLEAHINMEILPISQVGA